ncbi:DNA mismatch repair protein [Kickxella alabastrina]|uniref:DNA mismatch repair protein n=1 Tax=Kickxella alabastrina TaxID=61397 RepID=A0ACC1IKE1_9FUNG|nr:DNA mismatch repair protein [Kickxella alabastrina]
MSDTNSTTVRKPAPIQKLDESVINRIAAGEIINRPSNALKELIENSLDAGATSITISVKDGGIKLLQIQDNGHGIRTEDLPLVCERFTTSKLKVYEDLSTIQTYGFRGEALASISHVSHLSIITKQAESDCAYKANYADGKLVPAKPGGSSDPEPCAGNNGTVITAEDLFYNIPSRKSALKNTRDEYNRIFEVASRYAIHNSGVAFTCRKMGTPKADLSTQQGASTISNIRQIFGGKIGGSLVEIKHKDADLEISFSGHVSSAAHEMHKSVFLLFINHRLVDNTPIKRAVESLYSSILPKASRPFVYLDLRIKPENVDVNVHPTKREVRFLNEDRVTSAIVECMHSKLVSTNSSRNFAVQSSLGKDLGVGMLVRDASTLSSVSSTNVPLEDSVLKTPVVSPTVQITDMGEMTPETPVFSPVAGRLNGLTQSLLRSASRMPQNVASGSHKIPVNRAVRTDYKTLSLDSFSFGLSPSIRRNRVQGTIESDFSVTPTRTTPRHAPLQISPSHAKNSPPKQLDDFPELAVQNAHLRSAPVLNLGVASENDEPLLASSTPRQPTIDDSIGSVSAPGLQSQVSSDVSELPAGQGGKSFVAVEKEPRVEVRLTSILGLRKELQRHAHAEITQIFNEHSFVGFVDDRRALIQHQTRLYMVDYCKISYHLFHHRILFDFMNYGRLYLKPAPSIRELALVAAHELSGAANAESTADQVSQRFVDSSAMLDEYFHIRVSEDGCLESLPMVVRDYSPDYDKLPLFLHSATFGVDWNDEQQFFRTFINVLATLYALEPPLASDPQDSKDDYRMVVEHRIFPSLKGSSFWAPNAMLTENTLVQLVDVPDLYKIFERC